MGAPPAKRRRLGELLLAAGVVDETRLKAALADQKRWGGKLGRTLIDLGFVREEIMVKALSHQLRLPSVNLSRTTPAPEALSLVPVHICEKYGVFPIGYDAEKKLLSLATSDPTNDSTLRDIRLELREVRDIQPVVAGSVDLDRAIRRHYYGEAGEAAATQAPGISSERQVALEPTQPYGIPLAGAAAEPRTRPPPPPLPDGEPDSVPRRPEPAGSDDLIHALSEVARLEQMMGAEVRSLRVLVEMLVEKGLVDRAEYVRRVKNS